MERDKQAVAYCRVSTLEQKRKGYGIEIQVRDVTLFAQAQGLFVRRFYKDEAESGAAEHRTGLRRLRRDCQAGRVRTLIIPSLDRLSRDVRLAENLFYEFERFGVRVLIADMPTYNGKDRKDVLIRQIREAIAEENRKDIIERLSKGRQERVRRGSPPGGNVPYGYRRRGKAFEIDADEATTVRLILELADRAIGRAEVARALNEKGLRRRNGMPWTGRQVSAILSRHLLYIQGVLRYGEAVGENKRLALVPERSKHENGSAL
jgi:DNA invertase Pin-like site-specific DNA recombinase